MLNRRDSIACFFVQGKPACRSTLSLNFHDREVPAMYENRLLEQYQWNVITTSQRYDEDDAA